MGLSPCLDIETILAFLEFLSQNHLLPSGYISSLRTMAAKFKLPHDVSHYSVSFLLRASI